MLAHLLTSPALLISFTCGPLHSACPHCNRLTPGQLIAPKVSRLSPSHPHHLFQSLCGTHLPEIFFYNVNTITPYHFSCSPRTPDVKRTSNPCFPTPTPGPSQGLPRLLLACCYCTLFSLKCLFILRGVQRGRGSENPRQAPRYQHRAQMISGTVNHGLSRNQDSDT